MAGRLERLRQAAQVRHLDTLHRAQTALRALARWGEPITVRGVANAATVSRSWLYRQPQLLAETDRLRQTGPTPERRVPANQRASVESLRQQLNTYRDRTVPSRQTGAQRAASTPPRDRPRHRQHNPDHDGCQGHVHNNKAQQSRRAPRK